MSSGAAIMEICNSSLLLRNRLFSTASAQPPPAPPLRRQRKFPHPSSCIASASRIPRPMAVGSDTSVDTDDMYDDLFKKYGKVVYTANDKISALQEVDDDAESLSLAVAAAKVASDVKAGDIKVLFVKPLVYWTRFFIIATAFSRPQIDAIGSKIKDMAEEQFGKVATGDYKPNSWTLLDFGDVVDWWCTYFFLRHAIITTWKSFMETLHRLICPLKDKNIFDASDLDGKASSV